jgi:hypothetical protein
VSSANARVVVGGAHEDLLAQLDWSAVVGGADEN